MMDITRPKVECQTWFTIMLVLVSIPRVTTGSQVNQIQYHETADVRENKTHIRVTVGDLVFELTGSIDETWGKYITLETIILPKPYRLNARKDLVPLLEKDLRNTTGHRRAVIYMLASIMLPYIDDAKAADLYVRLYQYYKEGDWACMLPLNAKPADITSPAAWLKHTGNKEVLKSIVKRLQREEGPRTSFSLSLLTTTNSPDALNHLQEWFSEHKGYWSWGLSNTIPCGLGYPIASEPWKYLLFNVFPPVASEQGVTESRHESLSIWGKFCTCDAGQSVEGFSWTQIAPLAETYLDRLFNDQHFDRIIAGGYPDLSVEIDDEYLMMNHDYYENLLTVTKCFGTRRQVDTFNRALARYEGILFAEKTPAEWPLGRGGSASGPSYEMAVESYRELKASALEAMKVRRSSLPR